MRLLLVLVPLSIAAQLLGLPPTIVFVLAFLALIPLAGLVGDATEELAAYTGPKIGGLLNATLGTLTEFIIMFALLRSGQIQVLKASIVGSVLLSLLVIIGVALFLGGLKNGTQRFDEKSVSASSATMMLAVAGLFIPTLYVLGAQFQSNLPLVAPYQDITADKISVAIAAILFIIYLATAVFQLRAPGGEGIEQPTAHAQEKSRARMWRSIVILVGVTIVLAIEGELVSGAVEPFGEALGLSPIFMGVIILPFAGGVSELIVCARFARANQINLAISIPMNGAMQVPLFVAPLLVFLSLFGAQPLTLYFGIVEVIAVGIAVALAAYIAIDGITNWLEGAQFLAMWTILALWFYFHVPVQ